MAIQIASFPSPVMFTPNTPPRNHLYRLSPSPAMAHQDHMDNSDPGVLDIQRALDIARNTEGDLDIAVSQYLEARLTEVWDRIDSRPDTYVLTKDEFAIFNFFVGRYQGSEVAEKAIARFWSNYQENGHPSPVQ